MSIAHALQRGHAMVRQHFDAGALGAARGEPLDPWYGGDRCEEYPAAIVQKNYELGRLAFLESGYRPANVEPVQARSLVEILGDMAQLRQMVAA